MRLVLSQRLQKRTGKSHKTNFVTAPYWFPNGICAGQAWENETNVDLSAYHQTKTGALFIAATQMGAASAGHDHEPWFELGARIGEAFQVADDLLDVLCSEDETGKPAGQDLVNQRPNAVSAYGVDGAKRN